MNIQETTIQELIKKYAFLKAFFENHHIKIQGQESLTLPEFFQHLGEEEIRDKALNPKQFIEHMEIHILKMQEILEKQEKKVASITIIAGQNKFGEKESFGELTIEAGEIIAIVGPTGAGKSRLLGDIEWMAQKDTPTKRQILIDGEVPPSKWRFSAADKLVAQLSQNMNFVIDLSVYEFLELHAESRMIEDKEAIIATIIEQANSLSGESFKLETPVTSLSGGQSRALMIADTAFLSKSPIVLIDEIENAGIHRKKALELLLAKEKIVLIATHDPLLALMTDKRLVIQNGGITNILETSDEEKKVLRELEKVDEKIQTLRSDLRKGKSIQSF